MGLDLLIADGVVGKAECEQLVRTFEELQDLVFGASDVASFWDKRGIWYADVLKHRPESAAVMLAAMARCLQEMQRLLEAQGAGLSRRPSHDELEGGAVHAARTPTMLIPTATRTSSPIATFPACSI